jgi:hypothetical protein
MIAYGVAKLTSKFRLVSIGLLVWYLISSISVMPRSYSYFSEVIGGPSLGWKYLADSNLDWGQDILTVKRWVAANPEKHPVYILYSIPFTQFNEIGIDAQSGHAELTDSGPMAPGYWIVFRHALLESRIRWFDDHEPSERLSVTTAVFDISPTVADANRKMFEQLKMNKSTMQQALPLERLNDYQ